MAFYLTTTPWWLRLLFPGCVWDVKTNEKTVYLTFDDGPHPSITRFVLATLERYNAKASFFCIGDNVRRFPEMYKKIIESGHTVGNHTMHHINGWKHDDTVYLNDVYEAGDYFNSSFFRPPYGRIKHSQIKKLKAANTGMQIVMWSVLAGDWDVTVTAQQCFKRMKKAVYPGSIIVFHDSEKAKERMQYALPKLLEYLTNNGYSCKAL
jgi:peptidoglycan/xylan/chitin deacetylase (PgdA/CDA1 family)